MHADSRSFAVPQSRAEFDLLSGLVKSIQDFQRMSLSEQESLLRKLEAYECYAQAARLIEWRLRTGQLSDTHMFADYLWLMRIRYLGLERFDDFVETARQCIARLKLSFSTVRIHVAEEILGADKFSEHAQLYRDVADSFADPGERVLLLERLALLYEKKLFLEQEVEPVFARIIELDPLNIKALRFYKLWYMQGCRWQETATQLERLLEAATNPHERQRAAHELAQLYLYNLNQPQQARDIILEQCAGSVLDTRQTLIDALERLERFDELLDCLKEALGQARDDFEHAAIRMKQGHVSLKAGRPLDAVRFLRESLEVNPHSLLAHEALITALVETKDAPAIAAALRVLSDTVLLEGSKKAIDAMAKRAEAL